MPFASLNGVTLAVALNDVERAELEIGAGLERAFSGAALRSVQAVKRQWTLGLTPATQEEGVALVGLLQGRGDHLTFDADLYSDKGAGTSLNVGASRATSTPSPKWGAGRLAIAAAGGNQVAWPLQLGTRWTVGCWRYESSTWHWYWVRYNGSAYAVWKNGASSSTSLPSWLAVSSGSLYLVGNASTAEAFDDVWAVPYVMPTSWVAGLYALAQAQAFPQWPRLLLSGDLIPESSATVMGKVGRVRGQVGRLAGTAGFSAALEQLSVELWEA